MGIQIERRAGWPTPGEPGIAWLGQAGFWIETGHGSVLIDPYLSDSLAKKYAGTLHDHQRMMPAPILPEDLPRPDLVLITHGHTDHMDPETLGPLAHRYPDLPFVVPAAQEGLARERIGPEAHLLLVDAGEAPELLPGLDLSVLPAAHEERERDANGRHLFLGYAFRIGDLSLYHSGDCVPFEGLGPAVRAISPDIALLPVNGRDADRRAAGIPGNFTLEEAVDLSGSWGASVLVPHHFDMFDFNTCDPEEIDRAAAETDAPRILRPVPGETLTIEGPTP